MVANTSNSPRPNPKAACERFIACSNSIRRHPDPSGRRGTLVAHTDAGAHLVDQALTDALEVERRLLNGLDASRRDKLAHALQRLLFALEEGDHREVGAWKRADGS